MKEFSFPIRVYIEDTDAGGIVFYVNYLKYMERGRTELLRSLGFGKVATLPTGQLLVVYRAVVDYREPAVLDDQLIVKTALLSVARASVVFNQTIVRDDSVLCEGQIKLVCVKRTGKKMKPVALPHLLKEALVAHYTRRISSSG